MGLYVVRSDCLRTLDRFIARNQVFHNQWEKSLVAGTLAIMCCNWLRVSSHWMWFDLWWLSFMSVVVMVDWLFLTLPYQTIYKRVSSSQKSHQDIGITNSDDILESVVLYVHLSASATNIDSFLSPTSKYFWSRSTFICVLYIWGYLFLCARHQTFVGSKVYLFFQSLEKLKLSYFLFGYV